MSLQVIGVPYEPDIRAGDRLGPALLSAFGDLQDGDVVVVSSKAVAKAEGRVVDETGDWDALVRSESVRILRVRGDLFVTETPHGFVCANAGIDKSNTSPGTAVLLPKDPDNSAHVLRNEIRGMSGVEVATVVSDTNGRAWREGVVEQAIGCAGLGPIEDMRGQTDAFGTRLEVTQTCVADEIAGAAGLVMNKTERVPFAIVRGIPTRHFGTGSIAADVVRKYSADLFR